MKDNQTRRKETSASYEKGEKGCITVPKISLQLSLWLDSHLGDYEHDFNVEDNQILKIYETG